MNPTPEERYRWMEQTHELVGKVLSDHRNEGLQPDIRWEVNCGVAIATVSNTLTNERAQAVFQEWAKAMEMTVLSPVAVKPGLNVLRASILINEIEIALIAEIRTDPMP